MWSLYVLLALFVHYPLSRQSTNVPASTCMFLFNLAAMIDVQCS